jgi:GNAT superfamily N-acetyltransferase
MKITIKKARKKDFKKVLELINELAKFEKLNPPGKKDAKRLFSDAFGNKAKFNILTAAEGKNVLGYAFYFFTYSSFLARPTLYLEDLYVSENHRHSGIGKMFFNELNKIAVKNKCGRMEWCVLDWNTNAIEFYNKLGGKPMNDWIYYRKVFG